MTAATWGALVLVLLGFAILCSLTGWATAARRIWAPVSLLGLAGATVVAAAPPSVHVEGRGLTALLVILAGVLAVAGGGPVTSFVFSLVDRREPADALEHAATVLRGGAWIGVLERIAVFATIVAGWPEGLAVVLGVKSLARYPELRGTTPGLAERFIIGTFASVLWAAACAAVVWLVRGP